MLVPSPPPLLPHKYHFQVLLCLMTKVISIKKQYMYIPFTEYPNCLQTTVASDDPQYESWIVPQAPPRQTSTLPSPSFVPPASLTSPSVLQFSKSTHITLFTNYNF